MKRQFLRSIAAASLTLAACLATAGTRPHYGGTLRVQSRDSVVQIDNIFSAPNSVLRQQLAELLFDRLTRVDEGGAARTSLALSWKSDSGSRLWEFHLRTGVTFADGSPMVAADVVRCLSKAAPHWKITSSNPQTILIETETSTPLLPELLSLPEFSIFKTAGDEMMIGTGPFRVEAFQAARRIALAANDDYWGGRPYLDRVEITMGGSVREQLINRRLDQDDVVELSLDQARTIGYGAQSSPGLPTQRLAATAPSDLYALVFFRAGAQPPPPTAASRTPSDDPRIREAIALTIDRGAISRVLLQRQAEPADSLLPQWMTGYAFLFQSQPDLERARKLRNEAYRNAMVSIPLAYDSGDNVARVIAERIAVNAREVNITLQTFGEKNLTLDSARNTAAQAVLVRLPMSSSSSASALFDLTVRTGLALPAPGTAGVNTAEWLYAAERDALPGFNVVPVAHVPQIYWLNPRVRDWAMPSSGGWHLTDVWIDGERQASTPAAVLR